MKQQLQLTTFEKKNFSILIFCCIKRVALNVGGVRHEVMWKMLEQVGKKQFRIFLLQIFNFSVVFSLLF